MANQKVKWVNIEEDKLIMLIEDLKRFKRMFWILIAYLLFDLIHHLGWLEVS